jgi:hypothetical protein
MSANATPDPVQQQLSRALENAESLKKRIETGQDIELDEFRLLAQQIAAQMEEARAQLERFVGPIDAELLRAKLQQQLSPEEYAEWLEFEQKRNDTPSEQGQN